MYASSFVLVVLFGIVAAGEVNHYRQRRRAVDRDGEEVDVEDGTGRQE